MIETAQAAGASAQFAGSGGAIIGIYDDEAMYGRLQTELAAIGCSVILPLVR
jgi:glucuronokinase